MHETVAHEAESEKRVVVVVSVVAKKRVAGRLSKHQAFPPRSVQEQHLPNPPCAAGVRMAQIVPARGSVEPHERLKRAWDRPRRLDACRRNVCFEAAQYT